jgi:hypothetical protein
MLTPDKLEKVVPFRHARQAPRQSACRPEAIRRFRFDRRGYISAAGG